MKQAKPLTKEQYMKKFSRSARWRLGAAEAEEAIADYRELVFQEERDESKLAEELGAPVQAAWLLTDAREYKRWWKVFAVLAFGLLLMAKWSWTAHTVVRFSWDYSLYGEGWRGVAVMAVGMLLSLAWFRKYSQKYGALPKWLLPALAAMLAFGLAVLGMSWHVYDPKFLENFAELGYEMYAGTSAYRQVILYRELIIDGGTLCPVIAFAGLVLARLRDRRWLALYTLALTAAALCVVLEFWMRGLDLTWVAVEDIRAHLAPWLVPVGIAGLLGTGVALC